MNRSQRKRVARSLDKARKDLARAGSETVQDMSRQLELEQYVATLEILVADLEPAERAVAIARRLMETTEKAQKESGRFLDEPARERIACAAGCAWCCHEPLQVSPLDAISVADYLRRHGRSAAPLEEYRARLESEFGYQRERLKACFWACPFLDVGERLCSLYEARPVICRAFHSLEVATCERRVREARPERSVPMHLNLMGFVGLPMEGAHRALKELSVQLSPVVLGPAVALLLNDFESVTRDWIQGQDVFRGVQVT